MEVRERNALGDLEVDVAIVLIERITRLNDAVLVELARVDVDEQRIVRAALDRELAKKLTELTRAVVLDGSSEQLQRILELGRLRAGERFVREDAASAEID